MTRTRRPRTAAQVRTELARIDRELAGIHQALYALGDTFPGRVPDAVGAAWNGLHDAESELLAERREVEANRPVLTGATAELVALNID